ncbi:Ribosomal protein L28e [Balamuthia mandrillaris]
MASPDLKWLLVRSNNSFLIKRDGAQFSREPGNLRNVNSFKHSGLANNKVVDLVAAGNGAVLRLQSKKASKRQRPNQAFRKLTLSANYRRTAKVVSKEVGAYRPDLKRDALARWSRINQSLGGVTKKAPTHRARRNKH